MFKVDVERTRNGYVVSHDDDSGEEITRAKFCFQEVEWGEFGEEKALAAALLYIKEYFGVYHNKHKDINLYIGFTNQKGKEVDWDEVK